MYRKVVWRKFVLCKPQTTYRTETPFLIRHFCVEGKPQRPKCRREPAQHSVLPSLAGGEFCPARCHLYCDGRPHRLPWQILHCKKKVSDIHIPPDGMSLTKHSLGGKIKLFPPRESLVRDIPAGVGNVANLFLRWSSACPSRSCSAAKIWQFQLLILPVFY